MFQKRLLELDKKEEGVFINYLKFLYILTHFNFSVVCFVDFNNI